MSLIIRLDMWAAGGGLRFGSAFCARCGVLGRIAIRIRIDARVAMAIRLRIEVLLAIGIPTLAKLQPGWGAK